MFTEMLALSEQGDNSTVDMLVGDIYGQDYSRLGLKSTMIASSFGKVFKKGEAGQQGKFSAEDISRSLLYAISNNIGQIALVRFPWSSMPCVVITFWQVHECGEVRSRQDLLRWLLHTGSVILLS